MCLWNIQDALAKKCARRNQIFRHKTALLDDCEHRPGYCPGRKSCWNTKTTSAHIRSSEDGGPGRRLIRLPFIAPEFPISRRDWADRADWLAKFDWQGTSSEFTTSGGIRFCRANASRQEAFWEKPSCFQIPARAGQLGRQACSWALYARDKPEP